MALEDITKDAEEETKEEKVDEVSDELGVEDKEDLENLNDRIKRVHQMLDSIDKNLQELEADMQINRGAIASIMNEIGNPEDAKVKSISEIEEDEEDNPWLT